jgi:hypothetical protein
MIRPSESINPRLHAQWRRFSRAVGLLVAIMGGVVLMGWTFDIPWLKGQYQGINMKGNTALCFVFSGISLFLFHRDTHGSRWRRVAAQRCSL